MFYIYTYAVLCAVEINKMKQMSNIACVRRENTLRLMDQQNISRIKLAEQLDMGYSLLSAYIGKNPSKSIGDDVSSRLEKVFGIEPGALDINHELLEKFGLQNTPVWDKNNPPDSGTFKVPLYVDVRASCGSGYLNTEHEQNLEVVMLEIEKVRSRGILPKNVRAFLTDGDSMLPTIPHGAEVFIDSSKNTIGKDGGTYAVCHGGLLLIKKVFKMPNNALKLVSSNPDKTLYPDVVLSETELSNNCFNVLGPVFHIEFSIDF